MDTPAPAITPFGLQAVPAGMGVLPMGSLDHTGYSMSNAEHFYKKFIIELVPNNANHVTWYKNDLKPLNPSQPRIMTRLWNPTTRDACNAPDRMVVMYSKDKHGRGKIHKCEEVHTPTHDDAYWEARDWWYDRNARPRLVSFPLPDTKNGYAPYIWIDLSWPIRNILLPISQETAVGEQPNCTYVQLNFRQLTGKLPIDGFMEDGTQKFENWSGEAKRGLVWTASPATMRVDLKLLYILLTIPRDLRKNDYNVLSALQLHKWDRVSARIGDAFEDGKNGRNSEVGVSYERFLSKIEGVTVQYTPYSAGALGSILTTLVSFGLSFIPVVGPLLAAGSSLIMGAIVDPNSPDIVELLNAEFGTKLAVALLESALGYKNYKKSPGIKTAADDEPTLNQVSMPTDIRGPILTQNESPDDYKLTANIKEPTDKEKEAYQTYGPKQDGDDTTGGPPPVA